MYYTEKFNAYSHFIGLMLAILGTVILIIQSSVIGDPYRIVANSIFGASLIILYLSSTCYHSFKSRTVKVVFQKMDHVSIYFLIAGTYTPFMLIALKGAWGWSILGIVWGLAFIGMLQEFILGRKQSQILSLIIYVLMGWLGFIAFKPGIEALGIGSAIWLLVGGLFYTAGIYWYVNDEKIKHGHGIWHLFVLMGSLCHFVSIYKITVTV